MENQKNNKTVIALLVIIIFILTALCVLFATGIITLNFNNVNNNEINENVTENNNNSENTYNIKTKLVENLNNSSSEMAFNNISVKVVQGIDDMVCYADEVSINGIDISEHLGNCINSYEFYDDNVIIFSSHTSGTVFSIFSVTGNSVNLEFSSAYNNILKEYKVKSFSTKENVISIKADGCGAQCGVDNDGEEATFEIEYLNKSFSEPKLINKTTNDNIE